MGGICVHFCLNLLNDSGTIAFISFPWSSLPDLDLWPMTLKMSSGPRVAVTMILYHYAKKHYTACAAAPQFWSLKRWSRRKNLHLSTDVLPLNTIPSTVGKMFFIKPIITQCMTELPISEHVADHLCFRVSEIVIAHSSPDTVMKNFRTSFASKYTWY